MKNMLFKHKWSIILAALFILIIIIIMFFNGYGKYNMNIEAKVDNISIKDYKKELLDEYDKFLIDAQTKVPQKTFNEFTNLIVVQKEDIDKIIKGADTLKFSFIKRPLQEEINQNIQELKEYNEQLTDLNTMVDKVNDLPQKDLPGYFILSQIILNDKYDLNKEVQYKYDNENVKIAFLTFDDGPTENTDDIIKILKKNKVYGTFFIVGSRISSYEKEMQELVDSGNTIGMHSLSHDAKKISKGNEFESELEEFSKLLADDYGYSTNLVRVPTGSTILSKGQKEKLENDGYYIIDWDIDSRDWEVDNKKVVYKNVVNNLRKDCEVILFHEKDVTVEVLQSIIDELQNEGYYIMPMPPEYFLDYKFESLSIF